MKQIENTEILRLLMDSSRRGMDGFRVGYYGWKGGYYIQVLKSFIEKYNDDEFYRVDENIIGASKMRNNFRINIKKFFSFLSILLLQYWTFLYCSHKLIDSKSCRH